MTRTIENLAKAFAGESMARNMYISFAKIAKKQGFEQIAEELRLAADNEGEHANWTSKLINVLSAGAAANLKEIEIKAIVSVPTSDTAANLRTAIAAEHREATVIYPKFADIADSEGLPEIAKRLRAIGIAEAHHEEKNQKMLEQVEAGTFFKKDDKVEWACRKCGYIHVSTEPPAQCPACDHDRAYYQLKCELF
ncbi:MAG TPA: rubrerythrin family protein [Candidatus Acidoferrales bacterium]|nr:rubrerythrin family protein [Candidatus Acidoferrales bacterium]